jgi:type IV pili sensor histidine kinase/response regulator
MALDSSSLDLINQEVRNCFLYEDVPDYLVALEQNIELLLGNDRNLSAAEQKPIYQELMRIAHSLKGGAGIAQLFNLSRLAHQLENLIEALEKEQITDLRSAQDFLAEGVELINLLVTAALRGGDAEETKEAESLTIFQELESFLQEQVGTCQDDAELKLEDNNSPNLFLLKTALEVDLEECLQRVEKTLQTSPSSEILQKSLQQFIDECTLLGQVLKLDWLVDTASGLDYLLEADFQTVSELMTATITYLRQQREEVLNPQSSRSQEESQFFSDSEKENNEATFSFRQVEEIDATFSFQPVDETEATFVFRKLEDKDANPSLSSQKVPEHKFKISVSRLNRINNTFGELLINYERLSLQQRQIKAIDRNLKKQLEQFTPINEQIQTLYDRLATVGNPHLPIFSAPCSLLPAPSKEQYDILEFDRYTEFHSSLQNLQDLMGKIQESRIDLDLLAYELETSLDELRLQLNSLRGDLTNSRFVPFRSLTAQFATSLASLNQKYHKSVTLKVEGEDVLIDRLILEQLQTPLTHLFRNAFDHGIESTEQRLSNHKSAHGQITFLASIEGNRVIIGIADDGGGIDLNKVYQKAVAKGLCQTSIDRLSPSQILEFLFAPGFSTADKVTQLSGRGVGLDVVHLAIERLQGSIDIETTLGVGTCFTISIPVSLSIIPLLLCRIQQRTIAIPSIKVLEIISIADLVETTEIFWRDRLIPLYSLLKILPYTESDYTESSAPLALVLDVAGVPIAFTIDRLIEEKELVVKPFDNTVKIPNYAIGCTILGTGEVVMVISPNQLSPLLVCNLIATIAQEHNLAINKQVISILIVDDSIAVRRILDSCLRQSGYQVTQCKDGREALTTLDRNHNFDLVISDIEMPNLDGFGLLQEIRSRWQNLPVAMLTSRHNQLHRQRAADLGANAYFHKPFNPNQLLQAIEKFFR